LKRIAILGAGSWGTALAAVVAPNFEEVRLWTRDSALAASVSESRENTRSLPGIRLGSSIRVTADADECVATAEIVLVAVPTAHVRNLIAGLQGTIPESALIVSTAKGLEGGTLFRMTQVIAEAARQNPDRVLVLSGPSFANEVAAGKPAAIVIAGPREAARSVRNVLARPSFRVYSTEDRIGVEIGGALKNVVALGAGMAAGLGLGYNAVAALITRGLAEITRLAVAMGGQSRTLAGLSGLGDLVLTCTGAQSRNRQLGVRLSQAVSVLDVLYTNRTTTEGVCTAAAALQLGYAFDVEMPIAAEMTAVLEGRLRPEEAIHRLMERTLKEE
jgi:glycerol-3-phosphate dehydrogenase (NAD(P)+)